MNATSFGRGRIGLAACAVAALVLTAAFASAIEGVARHESSAESPGRGAPPSRVEGKYLAQSGPDPAAERRSFLDAAEGREAGGSAPRSPAVARAVEKLRAEVPPADEVYALMRVTDRSTGERRLLTRGNPDPDLGRYLADPDSAPEGLEYEEAVSFSLEEDVQVYVRSVTAHPRSTANGEPTEDEEEERALRKRNGDGPPSFRIDTDLRRRIDSGEIDLEASEPRVPVMIELKAVPPFRPVKVVDPALGGLLRTGLALRAERERGFIERKRGVGAMQRALVGAVRDAGGRVVYASWLSGSVQAEVPPAAIVGLAERADVLSIEFVPPLAKAEMMLDSIHVATNAEDYRPTYRGLHGVSGKGGSHRVSIAMSEECIDPDAPAWLNNTPGSIRRATFWDCDAGEPDESCVLREINHCWNRTDYDSPKHGHQVASMMVADFTQGQDTHIVGEFYQQKMTGTCPDCYLYFLQDQPGQNERVKAQDKACEIGVDIFQSSIVYTEPPDCDGNGPIDASIEDLIRCDVVYVQSAGNVGIPGYDCGEILPDELCTVEYPGDHPWTFTVAGMATVGVCGDESDYYGPDCKFDPCSSRGGADYAACVGCASVVDLTGPFRVKWATEPGTAEPTRTRAVAGTSFSSPIVAGLMGRFLDWWNWNVDTSLFYNNRLRTFFLLFGDRSKDREGTAQHRRTTDRYWGAGRVGLPDFPELGAASLYRTAFSLDRNETRTVTIDRVNPDHRFFKVAVWHNGKDYDDEPYIGLTVDPQGCATESVALLEPDSKALAELQLDGCSSVQVTVDNFGAGLSGRRRFHVAAYFHDGTTERTY